MKIKIKKGGGHGEYKSRENYENDNKHNDYDNIKFIRDNSGKTSENIKIYNANYLKKYTSDIEKAITIIKNKQIDTTEKNNCIFTAKYDIPIFNKSTLFKFDKVYNLEREYPFYNLNDNKVFNTFQDVIQNYINSLKVIKQHYIYINHLEYFDKCTIRDYTAKPYFFYTKWKTQYLTYLDKLAKETDTCNLSISLDEELSKNTILQNFINHINVYEIDLDNNKKKEILIKYYEVNIRNLGKFNYIKYYIENIDDKIFFNLDALNEEIHYKYKKKQKYLKNPRVLFDFVSEMSTDSSCEIKLNIGYCFITHLFSVLYGKFIKKINYLNCLLMINQIIYKNSPVLLYAITLLTYTKIKILKPNPTTNPTNFNIDINYIESYLLNKINHNTLSNIGKNLDNILDNLKKDKKFIHKELNKIKQMYIIPIKKMYNIISNLKNTEQYSGNFFNNDILDSYNIPDEYFVGIKDKYWHEVFILFEKRINKIINNNDTKIKGNLTLFRGSTNKYITEFKTYENEDIGYNIINRLTSCSLDFCASYKYQIGDTKDIIKEKSSLYKIEIPENTHCLFIAPLSVAPHEMEILLPTDKHYILTYKPKSENNIKNTEYNYNIDDDINFTCGNELPIYEKIPSYDIKLDKLYDDVGNKNIDIKDDHLYKEERQNTESFTRETNITHIVSEIDKENAIVNILDHSDKAKKISKIKNKIFKKLLYIRDNMKNINDETFDYFNKVIKSSKSIDPLELNNLIIHDYDDLINNHLSLNTNYDSYNFDNINNNINKLKNNLQNKQQESFSYYQILSQIIKNITNNEFKNEMNLDINLDERSIRQIKEDNLFININDYIGLFTGKSGVIITRCADGTLTC